MLGRLKQMMIKEFIQVFRDKRTRFILIGPPVIQMLVFGYAATYEIRHVPTVVVDMDHSLESRELVSRFTSSPYFDVQGQLSDSRQLGDLIEAGKATVGLEIHAGFAQQLRKGQTFLAAPDWPATVRIRAGKVETMALAAERIALLSGTVEIDSPGVARRPTGPVRATDAAGRPFETMAAAGDFRLLLPPGTYTVSYAGDEAPEVARQLVATAVVGTGGLPVRVILAARVETRGLRQTLFPAPETIAPAAGRGP